MGYLSSCDGNDKDTDRDKDTNKVDNKILSFLKLVVAGFVNRKLEIVITKS